MVGTEALKVSKLLQRLLPSLSIPVAHPCISIPIPAETCPTLQALSRAPGNTAAASAQILWAQSFESLLRACVLGFHSSDPRLGKAGCVQREAGDEGCAPHCGFSLKSHSVVLVVAGRSSQRAIKGAHGALWQMSGSGYLHSQLKFSYSCCCAYGYSMQNLA